MTRRALVVCPGRGSYDRSSLGGLQALNAAAAQVVDACDAWRERHGRPTVRSLDAADAFRSNLHVAGENASLLTFAASLADLAQLDRSAFEIVGVTGNSMGWYTALAAAGALPIDDAIELVDTMGAYQAGNVIGGQVLWPVCGDVRPGHLEDPARVAVLDAALDACNAAGHAAYWSIRLGGYAVLGADRGGVKWLLENLPKEQRGDRVFPNQLPLHSAFHTPLLDETAARARADLSHLRYRAPDVPLIDGRGYVFRPYHADPRALADYTLGHQVVAPYDLGAAVRTALRHTGADVVVALGPGNGLGGALARILRAERWGGDGFAERQAGDAPTLLSFGVAEQRSRLVG